MKRVAIVDDNAETQRFLTAVLEERGWMAVPCPTGSDAFTTLKRECPDVILLDLWLEHPDSGWQILDQLKRDPATASIPVVICSGRREALHEKIETIEEQAAAVLVKPFELDDVERCLDHVVSAMTEERVARSEAVN